MRIVVKIGSSSLVTATGQQRLGLIGAIVDDIALALREGHDVVLVSSGAIATGLGALGKTRRPTDLPELQAASAVGQGVLYGTWADLFSMANVRTAQVLLTMHDASHRSSWVNARNTLSTLLKWHIVPIVNENDTTATDEITFGDNDTLAAQVAVAVDADMLLLLTDTDGIFTGHPDKPDSTLIEHVSDHSLLQRIDTASPGSHWGSGGMRSKVVAAEMASVAGTTAIVTSAHHDDVVSRTIAGERLGTLIDADERSGSAFKLWLRYAKKSAGSVTIDEGALRAIEESGGSLLAVGITDIAGNFKPGDAVDVLDQQGTAVAKGLVEYGATEMRALAESKQRRRAAIHRDQLAVFSVFVQR